MPIDLSARNHRFFSKRGNVSFYVKYNEWTKIKPAESRIFAAIADQFRDKAILDIGVGAGRTTPRLLEISRNYIGTDYAASMVEACRKLFPGVTFVESDARRMTMFEDGQFDLVVFSYNGIDSNGPQDRLAILQEIHRVLDDEGTFFFSSLNRDCGIRRPYDLRNLRWTWNLLRMPFRGARFAQGILNHARMKKFEVETPEYAIRNAGDSQYTILLHYSTMRQQMKQLASVGFADVLAYDVEGKILTPDARETRPEIYYLARKRRSTREGTGKSAAG